MKFSETEIQVKALPDFPSDRTSAVCVTGAISIQGTEPIVDPDACFLCGLCAARCPTSAIALIPGKGAVVNRGQLSERQDAHLATKLALLFDSTVEGLLLEERPEIVADVMGRIEKLDREEPDTFRNQLVRNLFIHLGGAAALRRKGVNAMRMDLLASLREVPAVVIIEFGQEAILNAPRDLLDAMAVLHSRYQWSLARTIPFIVSDVLPPRRSDYWELVEDIRTVLGIEIRTVSLFALLLATLNGKVLSAESSRPFIVGRGLKRYSEEAVQVFLGRKLLCAGFQHAAVDILK